MFCWTGLNWFIGHLRRHHTFLLDHLGRNQMYQKTESFWVIQICDWKFSSFYVLLQLLTNKEPITYTIKPYLSTSLPFVQGFIKDCVLKQNNWEVSWIDKLGFTFSWQNWLSRRERYMYIWVRKKDLPIELFSRN